VGLGVGVETGWVVYAGEPLFEGGDAGVGTP
jgi:hypothetical protein